jgi:hypothetical protein
MIFFKMLSWAMMFGGMYLIYRGVKKRLNGGK